MASPRRVAGPGTDVNRDQPAAAWLTDVQPVRQVPAGGYMNGA